MFKCSQIHKLILTISFSCLLWTCRPKVELPTIPEEQLIEVLCDVHIMEGALQNRPRVQKDSVAIAYYNQVYERHNITESDFLTSLQRLEANPKLMSKIYKQVLVRLDTMEKVSYKDRYPNKK